MIKEDDIFIHFGGSFSGPAPKEFRNFDFSSPWLNDLSEGGINAKFG